MSELGLQIPIEGVQLVEASAGTGKTFTVATLYTRLVIECRLPVAKLLAVTYTEAAAKDLRDKLRERLARAATLVEGLPADASPAALAPRAEDGAADALTRTLLREALERGEALGGLRQRLRLAVAQMDLAPIHTIHGFCQRALREHALAAGQPLAPRTLVTNEATLRREVATEFWRQQANDADAIEALLAVWNSPEQLAESLQELLGFDALLPEAAAVDLRAARAAFAQAFDAHGEDAYHALRASRDAGGVSTTFSKDEQLDATWTALHRWRADAEGSDPRADELSKFGTRHLQARRLKRVDPPEHPFFDAIDAYMDARLGTRVAIVHRAVGYARDRLTELKRERQLVGFDDLIRELADALEGPQGEVLARALQQQYAVALVDEFQDTDPRQWRIFRRLFAQPAGEGVRALFLIGDPKQAIYRFRGGDVATYIIAGREATQRHRLERNFRSRPLALQATAAVFELGGEGAFDQPDIEFEPVRPGGACLDAHFQRGGRDAPALYVQQLALPKDEAVENVRRQLALNCVAAIHELLAEAQAGGNALSVRRADGSLHVRPVRPGDITVLVGRNDDALRMQRALSVAGSPAVAAGRSSLYERAEARDVHAFLAALAAAADDARLRALLATPLFGLDAAAIAAFDTDLAAHRRWQDEAQAWLATALRRGATAALAGVCARESARLLAASDGERRLSNYLQLVEELQAAQAGATGVAGLLSELDRRMQDADKNNDAELLRLESDAARVKIMTTHVSKGLNLDLVFVPFLALGGVRGFGGSRQAPPRARYHEGSLRVARLFAQGKVRECEEDEHEEFAEQLRVLYVALTRARFATWIGWGLCKEALKSPLGWLLHRDASGEVPSGKAVDNLLIGRALQKLVARAPEAIALTAAVAPERVAALPPLRFDSPEALPPARAVARALDRDWWVYSFSQLAREESGTEARGAEDEAEPPLLPRSRFSGTRFGNALHGALERVRFADWHGWQGVLPPPGQLEPLQESLRNEGFASEADQEEGLPLLTRLVAATLNARLPEGTVLATRPPESLCAEMEFHLELAPVAVNALLALLHAHGLVDARRGFGLRARLEGLLTGFIDLVYEDADGRFHVLDYKSNQLPAYDAEGLARSVREHEYDLQYVIYTLALHRWLRFRLGARYDVGRHLGGVRYLFCRGLDEDAPGSGVHALRLPEALVLSLDALLAAPREVVA